MKGATASIPVVVIVDNDDSIRRHAVEQGPEANHRRLVPVSVQPQQGDRLLRLESWQRLVEPPRHKVESLRSGQFHRASCKFRRSSAIVTIVGRSGVLLILESVLPVNGLCWRQSFKTVEQEVIALASQKK